MREKLEEISRRLNWIETGNLYQAIGDIVIQLQAILELLDQALPKEVEMD